MLSAAESPGRSPIRIAAQSAPSAVAMASPIATRPWPTTTNGAMPAFGAQRLDHAIENRTRMRLHGARRQPVRDHENDVIAAATRRQCRFGIGGKAAAEIRPHQIIRT